jgi:hypothetical protein
MLNELLAIPSQLLRLWVPFQIMCKFLFEVFKTQKVTATLLNTPKLRVQFLTSTPFRFGIILNGNSCHYRHALTQGLVLNSQKMIEEAEKAYQVGLEEFLEVEVRPFSRHPRAIHQSRTPHIPFPTSSCARTDNLGSILALVTRESFAR